MEDLLQALRRIPTLSDLHSALACIRQSPAVMGEVRLMVLRPGPDQRRVIAEATLDVDRGLAGDDWLRRGNRRQPGGLAHPDEQLTLINARVMAAIADTADWPLAGDQFYVDYDLSPDNVPPGSRLTLGNAVIEVTSEPHRGCRKFRERFGTAALQFVNSDVGCALNLRGIKARVIHPGIVRTGDSLGRITA